VEHEADVRLGGGELSRIVPFAIRFGVFARGKACVGIARAKSSEKVESLLRVRRRSARKCNTPTIITGKSTPTGC
jgi:hypothetical protein